MKGMKAVLILAAAVVTTAPRLGAFSPPSGASWALLSPWVEATYVAHQDTTGSSRLNVLVLWRGEPGWTRGLGVSSQWSRSGIISAQGHGRGLVLTFTYKPDANYLQVQGRTINLTGGGNVVLIDKIDGPAEAMTTAVRTVEPQMPLETQIEPVIRRSPELKAFLRCDAPLADPSLQALARTLCVRIEGGH